MNPKMQSIIDDASNSAYSQAFARPITSPHFRESTQEMFQYLPSQTREPDQVLDDFDRGLLRARNTSLLENEGQSRSRLSLGIPSRNDGLRSTVSRPDIFQPSREAHRPAHVTTGDQPLTSRPMESHYQRQAVFPQALDYSLTARQVDNNQSNLIESRRLQLTPPLQTFGSVYTPSDAANRSSSGARVMSSPTDRLVRRRPQFQRQQSVALRNSDLRPRGDMLGDNFEQSEAVFDDIEPSLPSFKHRSPIAHGIQLISTNDLPDRFRQIFPFQLFNAVQSKCFDSVYRTTNNVVVSAPTGSGKTAILELAICRLVEDHSSGQSKIVYQAPTKALCSERVKDWQKKFQSLNLQCAELTGDTDASEMRKVGQATIIVTTPEKWDSITRKWKDHDKLLRMVKLFLIDEVHILKDIRGATLEAVVSRMKSVGASVRFVALSATIPNSVDIATWLGKDHRNGHLQADLETFGEDFRPVRLQRHVYGFDTKPHEFAFDAMLDQKLPALIAKHSLKKPIIVFCFTRKSCEKTAAMLASWWSGQKVADRAWPAPTQKFPVSSKELRELMSHGVAYHHAGLDSQDRTIVEAEYLNGHISVIVCTSTLALGVNLPCHLVVVKGTVTYSDTGLCEYSDLEVMQMLGRAGRPQFDDSAVAIIMTRASNVDHYKNMESGQEVLESTLHLNLIEHLNSEVDLGTIYDKDSAKRWLSGTFLSVRMRKNPKHYSFTGICAAQNAEEALESVCDRDIKLLQGLKLITDEARITCTEYGNAMSRYMIQFETMKLLLSVPVKAKISQILQTIALAPDFKDLRMKPQERGSFRELNKSPFIKFPISENISTYSHKVSLVIQVQLGGVDLPIDKNFNFIRGQYTTDRAIILSRVQRLIRCIIDCKAYECDAISTRHALELARSVAAGYWEGSHLEIRQVPNIGPAANAKLVLAGIKTLHQLTNLETSDIERILSKNPPYGKKILDYSKTVPALVLKADIVGRKTTAGNPVKVQVKVSLGYANTKVSSWKYQNQTVTFMAEVSNGTLAHYWRGNIKKLEKGFEVAFAAELTSHEDFITCHLACDEIIGTFKCVDLKPPIPSSAFPALQKASASRLNPKDSSRASHEVEFDWDDIEESDILAAFDGENCDDTGIEDSAYDTFAEIDDSDDNDLEDDAATETDRISFDAAYRPAQMANGKWECNHVCKGGRPTRSGKACGHKCCHEGLNKPRRLKSRKNASSSTVQISNQDSSNTGAIQKKGPKQSKLKYNKHAGRETKEVEVVDLVDVLPAVEYSDIAPRQYRKLHDLHSKVQDDKPGRIVRNRSTFLYASGVQPDLLFLDEGRSHHSDETVGVESGGITHEAELPSVASHLHDEDAFEHERSDQDTAMRNLGPDCSDRKQSLSDNDAEVSSLYQQVEAKPMSPSIDFANAVFDFDQFRDSEQLELPEPVYEAQSKRKEQSSYEGNRNIKHRRVAHDNLYEEAGELQESFIEDIEREIQPEKPAWVSEIDKDLLEFLGDAVIFAD